MKKVMEYKEYINHEWVSDTKMYKKGEDEFLVVIKNNKRLKNFINDQKDAILTLNRYEAKATVKAYGTKQEYQNEFEKEN